jgi:hypothetical protein
VNVRGDRMKIFWLRRRVAAVAALTVCVGSAGVGVGAGHAAATSAPDQSLSGTASSMYQTNGTSRALVVSNGVVYAGGSFSSVRPPGAALGSSQTTRTDLAAFSTTTGAPTTFAPTLNGGVNSLALSANGSVLYAGGAFTTVNGKTRNHFAAFDLPSGALDPGWVPSATGGTGYAVAVNGATVYLGGTFGKVDNVAHKDLAAVTAGTGSLVTAFTATADNEVASLAVPADGSRLLAAGTFNTLGGQPHHAIGSLDPATGAPEPWAATTVLPDTSVCDATGTDVVISGSVAYVSGVGMQPGCYDGDFAANVSDGSVVWNSPCEGATQALLVLNGILYKGSHTHDCSYAPGGAFGGFTGALARSFFVVYRLLAQSTTDGSFVHWSPNTNGANGTNVGPMAFATDGTQLFLAGDFTTVNGKAQEGLTRFAPGTSAAPVKPTAAPVAVASGSGSLTVTFPAVTDSDNGTLSYTLYRGSTAVASMSAESWPWVQPTLRYVDTGLVPGTAYSYTYTASDAATTTAKSPKSTAVTALATVPTYPAGVAALSPSLDWQLDDSGTTVADSSGHSDGGQAVGGVTPGAGGAIGPDAAMSFDGSTGYVASSATQPASSSFTESAWFDTSTLTGGDILGTSSSQTGTGGSNNDVVWMDNDGQIVFAVNTPPVTFGGFPGFTNTTVRSPRSYDDGRWHQVVATYNGSTMSLYVDGSPAGTAAATATSQYGGYLLAGYDDLSSFAHVFGTTSSTNTSPNSYFFQGAIDEVATYPAALTAGQVAGLWGSGATAP